MALTNLDRLHIERRVYDAVCEARRDLHVEELHKKVMDLLDSMMSYMDTVENIQKWKKLSDEAKKAYDAAEYEAQCVGTRLRVKLLTEAGVDFWTGQYIGD